MRAFGLKKGSLSVALAVLVAVLVGTFALSSPMIVYAVRTADKTPTIVIDAGHGGSDGGVTGKTTGARESDLNLEIANLLGDMLRARGFHVVFTRTNDTMLSLVKSDSKKRSDMFSRKEIINSVHADVVVSIHMNYFPSEVRRGAQVFFERKDMDSFRLATAVQDSLNALNLDNIKRSFSPLTADKYILTCSPASAIIVECGFLSNPADEQLLISSTYQLALAEKIAQGIFDFYNYDIEND